MEWPLIDGVDWRGIAARSGLLSLGALLQQALRSRNVFRHISSPSARNGGKCATLSFGERERSAIAEAASPNSKMKEEMGATQKVV